MTQASRTALAEAVPLQPDQNFGFPGQSFETAVDDGAVYRISEGQFAEIPVDEDSQRVLLVTRSGDTDQRVLALKLEQDTDEEVAAHAELVIDDPELTASPEVVGDVLGRVMRKYYLRRVTAGETDVVGRSSEDLDAARFLAGAGFKEGEPGTYELRAAA